MHVLRSYFVASSVWFAFAMLTALLQIASVEGALVSVTGWVSGVGYLAMLLLVPAALFAFGVLKADRSVSWSSGLYALAPACYLLAVTALIYQSWPDP